MLSTRAGASSSGATLIAASLREEVALEAARRQSPRWQYTARPFSAASVVSLRCPLPTRLHYAGAEPAVKLYDTLRRHFDERSFSHTFGCLDSVQVQHNTLHSTAPSRSATAQRTTSKPVQGTTLTLRRTTCCFYCARARCADRSRVWLRLLWRRCT